MKRKVEQYFEENKPYAGLGRTSLRGGAAFVVARGINIIVQLASTILLARLLSPHDFGLVAMVLALVGFAPMLIDLGHHRCVHSEDAYHSRRNQYSVLAQCCDWRNA